MHQNINTALTCKYEFIDTRGGREIRKGEEGKRDEEEGEVKRGREGGREGGRKGERTGEVWGRDGVEEEVKRGRE